MPDEPQPTWAFESLRDRLAAVQLPATPGDRETLWVVERLLGLARSQFGAVEIFIVGGRLHPRTGTVRRHLEHGEWIGAQGQIIEASRIVLPHDEHFVAMGALIGVEMLRAGIGEGVPAQVVLEEVEPLIELALRRGALSEESLVGLIGELLALEQLLLSPGGDPAQFSTILDMWRGHRMGERDFVVGTAAIEVKTTGHDSSTHQINSLGQIELDEDEGRLFLLSVGLAPTAAGGQSLPDVVDRILGLLGGWEAGQVLRPIQQRLLRDVFGYGVGGAGYDHLTMSTWAAYQVPFRTTFTPRLYDVADPDVRLIRRADLLGSFVDPTSVTYAVDLPATVNGLNPVANWSRELVRLVGAVVGGA